MMLCQQHNQKIREGLNAWGLAHLAPQSMQEHERRCKAVFRGSKKVEDFDPVFGALRRLERLLEGQFCYDDDEDEDPNRCVICEHNADDLIAIAVNSTVARFHVLRGPVS